MNKYEELYHPMVKRADGIPDRYTSGLAVPGITYPLSRQKTTAEKRRDAATSIAKKKKKHPFLQNSLSDNNSVLGDSPDTVARQDAIIDAETAARSQDVRNTLKENIDGYIGKGTGWWGSHIANGNWKRYSPELGAAGLAGLGLYAGLGAIPKMRRMRMLRFLIGLAGAGAAAFGTNKLMNSAVRDAVINQNSGSSYV